MRCVAMPVQIGTSSRRRRQQRRPTSKPTTTTTTSQPTAPHTGGGSMRAATYATVATQRVPSVHGAISSLAAGGSAAANRPAGMPTNITNPATGTASRFAGSDMTGSRWKTSQLGTATPAWAPNVTDSGRRTQAGPESTLASRGARTHTPALAPGDNQKPTDHTSIRATQAKITTVQASRRTTGCGRPSANAELASIAIIPARSTDGSNRVSIMNQPISPNVADHRHHCRIRRKAGDAAANTNATFSPETAVRCERPEVRNAVIIDSGSRASSPITSPVNKAASAPPIVDSATRRSAERTRDEVR